MFGETFMWVGGGLALAFTYILISNTLWLLFGSKLVQSLPGVDIKGFRGTLKIAAMLVLSGIGILLWVVKYGFNLVSRGKHKPILTEEISRAIQQGSKILDKTNKPSKT